MPIDPSIYFNRLQPGPSAQDYANKYLAGQGQAIQNQQGQMNIDSARRQQAEQDQVQALAKQFTGPQGFDKRGFSQALMQINPQAGMAFQQKMTQEESVTSKMQNEAQEAYLKMTKAQRERATIESQEMAKAAQFVRAGGPPEQAPNRWDAVARQAGLDHLVGKFSPGSLDTIELHARTWQQVMDQEKENREGSQVAGTETTKGDLMWNRLKSGKLVPQMLPDGTQAKARPAVAPMMYSAPVELTDPTTGRPVVVRQDRSGNVEPLPGYAPKGGSERPLTEAQGNALGFGIRAREANDIMTGLETRGVNTGELKNVASGMLPGGNYLKSPDIQKVEQAQRNFVTAVLRKESGAAISAGEFETEAKKYFPQIGDSPEVIKQKQNARKTAIEVLQVQAGRDLPAMVKPVVADAKGQTVYKPGMVSKGYVFLGGDPTNPKNWKKQ